MTMKKKLFSFVAVLILVGLACEIAMAMKITLRRVVFEGPKRAEVITVINGGDEAVTYRLGWRHFLMTPDQSLADVNENALPPEIKPSKDMVKFAPRRFTLQPGASQQVRMILRMRGGVDDGEYRSHLWIRPEAKIDSLKRDQVNPNDKQGTVKIEMLAGVTMPVIIRKGNLGAKVGIADLQASQSGNVVTGSYRLIREGERSTYGDLEYTCNSGAGSYKLSVSRGNAIYAETNQRNMKIKIALKEGQPRCNSLNVVYREVDGFKGEGERVLAQATATVN
jgi:hypothetical protein